MNARKYTKSHTLNYALCVSDSTVQAAQIGNKKGFHQFGKPETFVATGKTWATVMDALHMMYPYIINHKYQPEDFDILVAKYKAREERNNE